MFDRGWPALRGEGNTRSEPSWQAFASSSTSRAASLSGTRCSVAAFILSAGMRHSRAAKSISSHTALRASPERAAVNTANRKHSLADVDAPVRSTTARASLTSV